MIKMNYRGYVISGPEGNLDVLDPYGDLIDGGFKTIDSAIEFIDRYRSE